MNVLGIERREERLVQARHDLVGDLIALVLEIAHLRHVLAQLRRPRQHRRGQDLGRLRDVLRLLFKQLEELLFLGQDFHA